MHIDSRPTRGRFLLDRNIIGSDIWEDAEMLRCFLWILADAEYKPAYRTCTDRTGRRHTKILQRGQTWVTERGLAEELKTTRKVVMRWLAYLEKTDRYTLEKGPLGTVLTVLKYDEYQKLPEKKGPPPIENGAYLNKETNKTNTGTGKVLDVGKQSGPARVAPSKLPSPGSTGRLSNPPPVPAYPLGLHNISDTPCHKMPAVDKPKPESRLSPQKPHSEIAKQSGPARPYQNTNSVQTKPKELLYTPNAEETARHNREITAPVPVTDDFKKKVHENNQALYRKLREVDEKANNERRGRYTGHDRLFQSPYGVPYGGFEAAYATG